MMVASALRLLSLVALGSARPTQFEVTSLPGWDRPLVSRTYCGFGSAGTPPSGVGEMFFNYIFLESERDPENDPVVVWYNGGPGAASMFGLFVEIGPYLLNRDSINPLDPAAMETVLPNPYSWTKVANIVAVNNPPPIGFSYCTGGADPDNTGPSGDGYSCGPWNDSSTAAANRAFLASLFLNDFPEFRDNDLFLAGESYAGIYVPTIARAIIRQPDGLNLKGFTVGDGCIGSDVNCGGGTGRGPYYRIQFFHGHGQVSEQNYDEIRRRCPEEVLRTGIGMSAPCDASIEQMNSALGGYFFYSLYDDCIYDEPYRRRRVQQDNIDPIDRELIELAAGEGRGGLNDYPCSGTVMSDWLDRPEVRRALNIQIILTYR
jgi:serine carboxypeptidase-like clade 1